MIGQFPGGNELSAEEIMQIFLESGAILEGHFVYKAGGHGSIYIEKVRATYSSVETMKLCWEIARNWVDEDIEVVVGPAAGAIKISAFVALALSIMTGTDVKSVYTEKDKNGSQILKRGREVIVGKRTLFIEDVINSGESIKDTIEACAGALSVGCHSLVDRSGGEVTAKMLGVEKFLSLLRIDAENYKEDCPLCREKVPIDINIGHGSEYLEEHPEAANWGKVLV